MNKTAGNCFLRLKDIDSAKNYYLEALKIRSNADEIYTNLGSLYLEKNKKAEAIRLFRKAIQTNSQSSGAFFGLGFCMLEVGKQELAFDYFLNGLKIDIKNPEAIVQLVSLAFDLKKYAEAQGMVERYLDYSPTNINLLYSLGGIQFHSGQFLKAKTTIEKVISLRSQHQGALKLLDLIKNRIEGSVTQEA